MDRDGSSSSFLLSPLEPADRQLAELQVSDWRTVAAESFCSCKRGAFIDVS